jgi:hypothetical protein
MLEREIVFKGIALLKAISRIKMIVVEIINGWARNKSS